MITAELVSARLRTLCAAKGIARRELHLRSGVSYSTLRRIETQPQSTVRVATLRRLCLALNVSLTEFLEADQTFPADEKSDL